MLDIDRFIVELDRLTTAVYFYDEIYGEQETIKIISGLSSEATRIIQRSLHNDIVMSLARLLYDGENYKTSEATYEYLSQYHLAKKYASYIDHGLQNHRDEIAEIKASLNVKDYRDLVLAHNDKATLTGENDHPKHNLETEVLLRILRLSRTLFFGVRLKLAKERGEQSLPITDGNVHRNGVGTNFLKNIENITRQARVTR
ncbi:hypothetical protein [Pseudoalteromonas sp. S2755]|uniref:AbiU2 domain-containing protein n=1 Tax=Pseudoalteromonas sp. S2755 TaxID=2066523 RepID=UPI00110A342D|nr:hypothetical protein [Pseudoalteromonas sp. S2755]TMN44299.1 hypothetical protein CWC03_03930 [Pseudoalteromonas sp. S2755]